MPIHNICYINKSPTTCAFIDTNHVKLSCCNSLISKNHVTACIHYYLKQAAAGSATTTVQIEENHIVHKDSNELLKLLHYGSLSRWIEQ